MQRSAYLLGRKPIRQRLTSDGECLVSVVACKPGTPDEWLMYIETSQRRKAARAAGPHTLYKIRVKLKAQLQ